MIGDWVEGGVEADEDVVVCVLGGVVVLVCMVVAAVDGAEDVGVVGEVVAVVVWVPLRLFAARYV